MAVPPVGAPRAYRLLIHDPDEDRGRAIALRARLGGHVVTLEPTAAGLRRELLAGTWDAVAIEVLGGTVPSPFLLLEARNALRSRGRPMPPAVVYVRDALIAHPEAVAGLLGELGTGVECVPTEDADRVVRTLERAASGRRPAAIPISRPVAGAGPAIPGPAELAAADQPATVGRPAAVGQPVAAPAGSPDEAGDLSDGAPSSPASNWSR